MPPLRDRLPGRRPDDRAEKLSVREHKRDGPQAPKPRRGTYGIRSAAEHGCPIPLRSTGWGTDGIRSAAEHGCPIPLRSTGWGTDGIRSAAEHTEWDNQNRTPPQQATHA